MMPIYLHAARTLPDWMDLLGLGKWLNSLVIHTTVEDFGGQYLNYSKHLTSRDQVC